MDLLNCNDKVKNEKNRVSSHAKNRRHSRNPEGKKTVVLQKETQRVSALGRESGAVLERERTRKKIRNF